MNKYGFKPLSKVVSAAMVDTYADTGATQHRYSHWAARGLNKLIRENLRLPIRRALLPINKSLMTATLPLDFKHEVFVGFIEKGKRVPIYIDRDLINYQSISKEECNKCDKCNQEKIVEELNTEYESDYVFTHADVTYNETVIKKISPDGSYWIIKNTPYLNVDTDTVSFRSTKEWIDKIDLASCGCVLPTDKNKEIIKTNCPDVYQCYYSDKCSSCSIDIGGYKIFEETGIIQLSDKFKYDKLYIEYNSFLPRVNGEFQVPEVAFETLVSLVKFKAIENKPNTPPSIYDRTYQRFKDDRSNMSKVLGRASLSSIINKATSLPKFTISN